VTAGARYACRATYPAPRGRHARFSIWQPDGSAAAAVSLDDAEAARLASFLQGTAPAERQSLFERLARR